jgi:hypothetical protein
MWDTLYYVIEKKTFGMRILLRETLQFFSEDQEMNKGRVAGRERK